MVYLQAQLNKERNPAFIAIGKISHAVGAAIRQYLNGIIFHIREGLAMKVYVLLLCL
jgi:FKBP12-rapamycin complex-associated protein